MSAEQTSQDMTFEEALSSLQGIVASLESGDLGLEESLAEFEKGIGLLKTCNDVLEQAEGRIEALTGVDADGNPVVEPFDNQATIDSNTPSAGEEDEETGQEDDSESVLF